MRVLFFSPHAFVDVHAMPEALVAASLQEGGHEIRYVGCRGIYGRFCIAMSAGRLRPTASAREKENVCKICRQRKKAILNEFGFLGTDVEDHLVADDLLEIERLKKTVDRRNWSRFEVDGVPVGRYASYEFLLNEKINTTVFSEEQWPAYLVHLEDSLKTLLAGKRLLRTLRPDAVAGYNNMYSVNHIVCALAERQGIPHYTLHAGAHHVHRVSQMTIFRGLSAQFLVNRGKTWDWFATQPLSAVRIATVASHVHELLKATSPWVYSVRSEKRSSAELRNFFGIDPRQKVLLVTMASADERFAAALVDALPPYEEPIFKSQLDWLRYLIDWLGGRPEYFLVIRVHPREFPNKREKVLSAQAKELSKHFDDLPPNVRVNWPEEKVSLHDLAKITDVGLNATSTAGLELLLFGIPVVVYDRAQLFCYPRELNLCADSPEDYLLKIDEALSSKWSIDNVVAAYRWLSYRFDVLAVDISDTYRAPSFLVRVLNELLRLVGIGLPLPGLVRGGGHVPQNAARLRSAIENNPESHLDGDSLSPIPNRLDVSAERALVLKTTLAFARQLGMDECFRKKLGNLSAGLDT